MRHSILTVLLFVPVLIAHSLTTACAGTETGNPAGPDYTHDIEPAGVGTTVVQHTPATPSPPEIIVEASPGSVTPATGTLYAWPLENNLPGVSAPIESDGSFSLDVPALAGDLIRLQVRAGMNELSPPLDIVVAESGEGFTRFNTAIPCLRTSPELALQVDVGGGDAIIITNDCDETVTRSAARVRETGGGVVVLDDGRNELAPGEQSTIRVRIDDAAASPVNILFSLTQPVQELRAISVGID